MAMHNEDKKWWIKKSKKNDPKQPEYQEFTGFDTWQNAEQWSNSSSSKLNVPYDTNAVPGLYNSSKAINNQSYVIQQQAMANGNWNMSNSGWNGYNYINNYSEEVLRKSQPIIDYLTKVLQFR